nr:zinc finger BED domain-containing protein RICESLEEPER 2-like [Tanacetum cinerariifolium]
SYTMERSILYAYLTQLAMASQSSSTTPGAGSSSAPTVLQILPTNQNPQIWKDFNLCKMTDNTTKAQCKHCFHFFLKDSNSTLKNHISHPHCEALKRVAKSGQSSMSRDGSIFMYNLDVLREQLAGLVIQRGLSFKHFDDDQTTRVFQNHYNQSTIILTMNVWTAPRRLPGSYICVTAHWIEPGTWQIMMRVIAFEDFPVTHTGSVLAKTLRNMFVNFNSENKFMSITLDNASNNTSAIDFVTHLQTTEFAAFDVLGFRKAKETMFLVLSRMAMDMLSVQATLVASESTFSTSGRVLSIRRTRLTPASLEMCMCFGRSRLLNPHFQQVGGCCQSEEQDSLRHVEEEILDVEVQENKAIPPSDEEIAFDAASNEGSMFGPGLGGKDGDYGYDMTNYHDDY